MKPVKQTSFGYPHGNCFAACVASILEIPLEECPIVPADSNWHEVWNAWFAERGIAKVTFKYGDDWRPTGWCILAGRAPREIYDEKGERAFHAVVGKNGETWFDPHPDNTFLDGPPTEVDILYPTDPSVLVRGAR